MSCNFLWKHQGTRVYNEKNNKYIYIKLKKKVKNYVNFKRNELGCKRCHRLLPVW